MRPAPGRHAAASTIVPAAPPAQALLRQSPLKALFRKWVACTLTPPPPDFAAPLELNASHSVAPPASSFYRANSIRLPVVPDQPYPARRMPLPTLPASQAASEYDGKRRRHRGGRGRSNERVRRVCGARAQPKFHAASAAAGSTQPVHPAPGEPPVSLHADRKFPSDPEAPQRRAGRIEPKSDERVVSAHGPRPAAVTPPLSPIEKSADPSRIAPPRATSMSPIRKWIRRRIRKTTNRTKAAKADAGKCRRQAATVCSKQKLRVPRTKRRKRPRHPMKLRPRRGRTCRPA